jgi:predicted deacylase
MAILQPDLIKVEGVDERITLFEFRGGELKPSVFIVAGQHGGEISGIGVAYRLIECLKGIDIQGRVSMIPILNVWGVRAGTRENPLDGITINSCYEGGAESLSYRLADLVKELAAGYDYVLDLHSAGYARYERHIIFHHDNDIEIARHVGFQFLIKRFTGKEGKGGSLTSVLSDLGKTALTLELGGGHVVYREDLEAGLEGILRFFGRVGLVDVGLSLKKTPLDRVYREDCRVLVKAEEEGIYLPGAELGREVKEGESLGDFIPLDEPSLKEVEAPQCGWLIYLRNKSRIGRGETIAALIPK